MFFFVNGEHFYQFVNVIPDNNISIYKLLVIIGQVRLLRESTGVPKAKENGSSSNKWFKVSMKGLW